MENFSLEKWQYFRRHYWFCLSYDTNDFGITRMITDRIGLHSFLLPSQIALKIMLLPLQTAQYFFVLRWCASWIKIPIPLTRGVADLFCWSCVVCSCRFRELKKFIFSLFSLTFFTKRKRKKQRLSSTWHHRYPYYWRYGGYPSQVQDVNLERIVRLLYFIVKRLCR